MLLFNHDVNLLFLKLLGLSLFLFLFLLIMKKGKCEKDLKKVTLGTEKCLFFF